MKLENYVITLFYLGAILYLSKNVTTIRCAPAADAEGGKAAKKEGDDGEKEDGEKKPLSYYFTGKDANDEGEMGFVQYLVWFALILVVVAVIVGIMVAVKAKKN